MSNIEDFLTAILNDEHLTAVDIISRMDKYLKACCTGEGCEGLPQPQTRADVLLYELADKLSHGGGGAGYVDTKKLTNLDNFCKNGKNLEFGIDPNLDTSNVTSMLDMYHSCSTITELPELNTSKVTLMQAAFYGCSSLQEIKTLDTSKATNLMYLFGNCTSLKSVPQIDAGLAVTMDYMFDNCNELTDVSFVENSICVWLDLHWSTKLSRNSLLSILKGLRLTLSGRHLKLPQYVIDGETDIETFIESDSELNEAYEAALDAGWVIEII